MDKTSGGGVGDGGSEVPRERGAAEGPRAAAADLRPSVARTPTQAVLRIVSVVMALLGFLTLVGGVLVLATDRTVGVPAGNPWTVATFGSIILVVAGLLLLTAVLGIAASDDSSRVGPYRFLCYLVGLVVLVAIAWGWGLGTFILFNPAVLATTVVYVLVCSSLADKIKQEYDRGVVGEVFLRSRHQRAAHLLAEVIVLKGTLTAVVTGVVLAAVLAYGEGTHAVVGGVPVTVTWDLLKPLAEGAVAAAVDLAVGCLGIWGSNRPRKIAPFLVLTSAAFVADVVRVVPAALLRGGLAGVAVDRVFDLVFMGACAFLAWKVLRHPPVGESAE